MLPTNSASPKDDEVIATAQEVTASEADQATTDDPAELAEESNIEKGETKAAATTPVAPEKIINPVTTDPYEFEQCTIAVQIVLLPHDGDTHGREVMIGVRNHQDTPIIRIFRMDEIQLPEAVTGLLDELRSQLPMRAMEKIQRETKEKEAKKRKPATTTPSTHPLTTTVPSSYPTGTMSSASTASPVAPTAKTGKQPSPGQLDMFNAINQ